MKIPYTSDEQNLIRGRPAFTKWYLAVHQPDILWAATLAAVPDNPGQIEWGVTLTGVQPVVDDFMMYVGTSIGDHSKGMVRARFYASGNVIWIAETAITTIPWEVGDVLTVIEDLRPLPKHIRFDATANGFVDYDIPYLDQTIELIPQAVMGPPAVGYVDEPIYFVGEHSKVWQGGATFDSCLWVFPDGSVSSDLGTEDDPVIWIPEDPIPYGSYVFLIYRDSNGHEVRGARLCWVFERESAGGLALNRPPKNVMFNSIKGDVQSGGYQTSVTVYDETSWFGYESLGRLSPENYPGGTQCVIFEEVIWPDGDTTSIGGNYKYRENIIFWGWATEERLMPAPANGGLPGLEMTISSVNRLLEQIQVYPVAMEDISAPTNWLQFDNPTADKMLHHLCHYRSTLARIIDFFGAGSYAESEVTQFYDLEPGSLWSQIQSIYGEGSFGPLALVGLGMQGGLYADLDANILATDERGVYPEGAIILEQDRRTELEIGQSWTDPAAQVVLWGVDYDEPLGSRAPDDPIQVGADVIEHPRLIAPSQTTLNDWSGNIFAKENTPTKEITIPTRNYRLDCFPQSFVTLTLTDANLGHRLTIDEKVAWIRGLEYGPPQSGMPLASVTVELDISGPPGVTIVIPDLPDNPPPPPDDPIDPPDPIPLGPWPNCWVCSDTGLWAVTNIIEPPSTTQPTIYDASGGFSDFTAFAVDPFNTGNQFCHFGAHYITGGFSAAVPIWYRSELLEPLVDPWDRTWNELIGAEDIRLAVSKEMYPADGAKQLQVKIGKMVGLNLDLNHQGKLFFTVEGRRTTRYCTYIAAMNWNVQDDGTITHAGLIFTLIQETNPQQGSAGPLAVGAFSSSKTGGADSSVILASGGQEGSVDDQWRTAVFKNTTIGVQEYTTPLSLIDGPSGDPDVQDFGLLIDPNDNKIYYYWRPTTTDSGTPAAFIRWDHRDEADGQYSFTNDLAYIPSHPATIPATAVQDPGYLFATCSLGVIAGWQPASYTVAQVVRYFSHSTNYFVRLAVNPDTGAFVFATVAPTGDIGPNTAGQDLQCWGVAWLQTAQQNLYLGKMWDGPNRDGGIAGNPERLTVFCIAKDLGTGSFVCYNRGASTISGKIIAIVPDWENKIHAV